MPTASPRPPARRPAAPTSPQPAIAPRPGPPRALRLALLHLLLAGAAVAAAEVAMTVRFAPAEGPAGVALVAAYPLIGLECVAVGIWTWDRRPANATGALLCALGFSVLVAAAGNTGAVALDPVPLVASELPIAVLLHLLLAFPGGRTRSRLDRALIGAGYLVTLLPAVVTVAVDGREPGPGTAFTVAADRLQSVLAATVLAAAIWSMGRHAVRAGVATGERRARATVYVFGVLVLFFLPLSAHLLPWLGFSDLQRFGAQIAALALVPVAFSVALFRGGFARTGEIQELAGWLAAREADRPPLRDALARVLGDDSVELLFPDGRTGVLLDPDGHEAVLRAAAPDRGVVTIPGPDGLLAVVVHDRRLIPDPAVVETAGRMVALALERERLTAELLAGGEVIRRSRARILEVGDAERRRFAHDLHDLLQGRLVLAAVHAGRLAAAVGDVDDAGVRGPAEALRRELEAAVIELRRQVHGVMPAPLLERGLLEALADLADRVPLRTRVELPPGPLPLPPAVASSAYFIAAEAVANAVKHARAGELRLTVCRDGETLRIEVADDGVGGTHQPGAGLRGMTARAEALDGRLDVDSTPGAGTRIVARLPCGW